MSKQSEKIIDAYAKGSGDKRANKSYHNPYNKNKDRDKHKAYYNGYHD